MWEQVLFDLFSNSFLKIQTMDLMKMQILLQKILIVLIAKLPYADQLLKKSSPFPQQCFRKKYLATELGTR